jgi:hypothetical protein
VPLPVQPQVHTSVSTLPCASVIQYVSAALLLRPCPCSVMMLPEENGVGMSTLSTGKPRT